MKKKESVKIGRMITLIVVIIVALLIALIVFLATININTSGSSSTNSTEDANNVANNTTENTTSFISIDEIEGVEYTVIAKDDSGAFEVELSDGTVNFHILDEDAFQKKYPKSKVEESDNEVAIHDYHIQRLYIGTCDEKEYLFALTTDGSIGIMDIEEAVNDNVFRIKNQLITLDSAVESMYSAVETSNNKQDETVIVITESGKKLDLSEYIK